MGFSTNRIGNDYHSLEVTEEKVDAHLDFRALLHLVLLRYCVCDYNCLKTGIVDPRNSWPRKDPMS